MTIYPRNEWPPDPVLLRTERRFFKGTLVELDCYPGHAVVKRKIAPEEWTAEERESREAAIRVERLIKNGETP